MKNPKIYFVSAPIGMWCDFIAYRVSCDANYYKLPLKNITNTNKWNVGSALSDWSDGTMFDLKGARTPEEAQQASIKSKSILQPYNEKHYVVQSHYCGTPSAIDLPNLQPIRITCNEYYSPFFCILGIIKVFLGINGFGGNAPSVFYVCDWLKMQDPFAVIASLWTHHFKQSECDIREYTELSLTQLFEDDAKAAVWQKTFDMHDPLDMEHFRNKWNDDLRLIEDTFYMPYDELMTCNWMSLVFSLAYKELKPYWKKDQQLLEHFYNKAVASSSKL